MAYTIKIYLIRQGISDLNNNCKGKQSAITTFSETDINSKRTK